MAFSGPFGVNHDDKKAHLLSCRLHLSVRACRVAQNTNEFLQPARVRLPGHDGGWGVSGGALRVFKTVPAVLLGLEGRVTLSRFGRQGGWIIIGWVAAVLSGLRGAAVELSHGS